MTGHTLTIRRRRLALVLAMSTLLPALPAAAQSPTSPDVTAEPVATPAGSLIDPRSAAGRLLGMRDSLEADRLLLAELRKDVPTTREAAQAFVDNVVGLALVSDPAALGVIVSRVRQSVPVWLEWRDGQYTTAQEAADAYARTGAGAFDVAWESLHDAALLTIINRLDTIIDLADRIEDGQ